jgi:hydrogenase maturation protease
LNSSPIKSGSDREGVFLLKTLIIGLGNPILRDDGIGIRIAEKIKHRLNGKKDIEVIELSVGGLRLMEAMSGYDRVIIIDAVITGQNPPGTIYKLGIADLSMSLHTSSTHDTSLACAIESGKRMGMKLTSEVVIWGIEVSDVSTFGETMIAPVESAIPLVVERVIKECLILPSL